MAVTMVLFWFFIAFSIIGSHAGGGEFVVLHSPDSLKFSGSSETRESHLKEIFSASLGLAVEENSEWDGLKVSDPFNTAEAVIEVYVDGVSSLGIAASLKSVVFPLNADEYEPDTFDAMKHRIKQRYPDSSNKLVNIILSDSGEINAYPEVFGDIGQPKLSKQSLLHLKPSIDEDNQFLAELENLKAITKAVKSGVISADNSIDFYNFRFRSLHALSDFHGPNSLQTKEAKNLLGEALVDLSKAFIGAYDGSVLVTGVATDVAHTRKVVKRQATQTNQPQTLAQSQGESYPADYAAIFNILLWFGVVFTFTLVAIVYAIMDMDPGRDSIIYRMTSTRMKKDN